MWNLPVPDISETRLHLDRLFEDGVVGTRVKPSHKDKLELLYKEYIAADGRPNAAWAAALSTIARQGIHDAYSQTQEGGMLSSIRHALKLSVTECPSCGFGEIKELDHHLQRAHYQCFSIFPVNLVPACSKCNGHKPRKPRADARKQHLHAYLEDMSRHSFLKVKVRQTKSAMSIKFYIVKRASMSDELFARLNQHLIDFKLNDRYPAQVNKYLSEQFSGYEFVHSSGGAGALRSLLEKVEIDNRKIFGRNDWRTALAHALARSGKFCNGGYLVALGHAKK